MNKKFLAVIAIAVITFGLAGNALAISPTNPSVGTDLQRSITTTGIAQINVEPDKAEIMLGVETQSKTAQTSQQENARIITAIKQALVSKGISKEDIVTSHYNVYPQRDWKDNTYEIVGYRTVHMLKINTKNLEKVGEYIDAAVNAGANRVQGVYFSLTNEKRDQIKIDALAMAAKNARVKADAIASGLEVRIVRVLSAT